MLPSQGKNKEARQAGPLFSFFIFFLFLFFIYFFYFLQIYPFYTYFPLCSRVNKSKKMKMHIGCILYLAWWIFSSSKVKLKLEYCIFYYYDKRIHNKNNIRPVEFPFNTYSKRQVFKTSVMYSYLQDISFWIISFWNNKGERLYHSNVNWVVHFLCIWSLIFFNTSLPFRTQSPQIGNTFFSLHSKEMEMNIDYILYFAWWAFFSNKVRLKMEFP